jgi:hypothetical protein
MAMWKSLNIGLMEVSVQIKALLLRAGLNEAESQIYLRLLKKPVSSKWQLVLDTSFNKNKVYRACERLSSLNLISFDHRSVEACSLQPLIEKLDQEKNDNTTLIHQLKQIYPLLNIPAEAINSIKLSSKKGEILEDYQKMSQFSYDTCLDFGDLEGFVKVLGGLDPVFKFRKNRYKQNAKNVAICTTSGPFTSCMARKSDQEKFKAKIKKKITSFIGKWIIFSDTDDHLMFNDFANPEAPVSLTIKSKLLADSQRMMFAQF